MYALGCRKNVFMRSGLGLVELLVSIAVVVILASIALLGIGRIHKTTDNIQCTNNLRSISAAIHLYIADHSGQFPGPNRGDTIFASTNYRRGEPEVAKLTLWDHLMDYLDIPDAPPGARRLVEIGVCPAAGRSAPNDDWIIQSKFYRLNAWRSSFLNEPYPNTEGFPVAFKPFGSDLGSGESRVRIAPNFRVEEVIMPSRFALMMDEPGNYGASWWHAGVPRRPSHETHFNVLYLDGRVDSEPYQ